MLVFAARRMIQAIPILFGVSLVVFGLVHIVPGNPIDLLMPPEASPEVIAQMKKAFGFDQPLWSGRDRDDRRSRQGSDFDMNRHRHAREMVGQLADPGEMP